MTKRPEDRPSAPDIALALLALIIAAGLVIIAMVAKYDSASATPKQHKEALPHVRYKLQTIEPKMIPSISPSSKPTGKTSISTPQPTTKSQPTISVTTSQPPQSTQRSGGSSSLPALLLKIRSCESGPCDSKHFSYTAYNPTGCEGYGCGGAYQLHAEYASGWAAEAGYPGMSSQAQNWPGAIQDAVALYKFNATGGALWCDWASYC